MTIPAARVVFGPEDRARILGHIDQSLQSGSLTLGSAGRDFEEAFARRHEVGHAVATSSGTSALEIIMRTLGVGDRDVVVPANTFFATAAAVLHAGGRVRFADADPATLSVSVESVEAAVTPATTAIVVVHIGGRICRDIEAIADLCERRGIDLVEDAAHAHGSTWAGQPAGTFSRAAAFSFYPTKVVASGEGGMIVTGDADLAADARIYRDQGKGSFLEGAHVRLGSAWRMSEVHAAIGRVHLDRLDEFIAVRRRVADLYDRALAGVAGVTLLSEPEASRGNVYKYPLLLDRAIDQTTLAARLRDDHGVSLSGKVYATPLPAEPVFAGLVGAGLVDMGPPGGLEAAVDVCARHICLPVHSDMTDPEADQVTEALLAVLPTAAR